MYWNNPKSEFYGIKLDGLGPVRLRLTMVGLMAVDYVFQRSTAGTIFNLLPDDCEFWEHRHLPGPALVRRTNPPTELR
jgi:hypothetical protein